MIVLSWFVDCSKVGGFAEIKRVTSRLFTMPLWLPKVTTLHLVRGLGLQWEMKRAAKVREDWILNL